MQNSVAVHKQLDHFVTEYLRTAVLDGHLESGEWLWQPWSADELGVSELPVREERDRLRTILTQVREQESLGISSYSLLNHRFHQFIYTAGQRDYPAPSVHWTRERCDALGSRGNVVQIRPSPRPWGRPEAGL